MSDFRKKLETLLEAYAQHGDDTPDSILAVYLQACLDAFDRATGEHKSWQRRAKRALGEIPLVTQVGKAKQALEWVVSKIEDRLNR